MTPRLYEFFETFFVKGTDDPALAKNWHYHAVSKLEAEVQSLTRLIRVLEGSLAGGTNEQVIDINESINLFKSKREMVQNGLNDFLKKWPKPIHESIKDTIIPEADLSTVNSIGLSNSLPFKPLICINDEYEMKFNPYLYFRDNDSINSVYKVLNMHYNRPNERYITHWQY